MGALPPYLFLIRNKHKPKQLYEIILYNFETKQFLRLKVKFNRDMTTNKTNFLGEPHSLVLQTIINLQK